MKNELYKKRFVEFAYEKHGITFKRKFLKELLIEANFLVNVRKMKQSDIH